MKTWGLSRWGPLLAVLTLLVSAGALIAPGAQAAGKTVWALVTDCAAGNPVTGATVTLVDAQAQRADLSPSSTGGGVYTFSNPPPAYYTYKVQPSGFIYFSRTSPVFRFDGTKTIRVPDADICVDKMPTRNRWLNASVIDAQPSSIAGEIVTFQEFTRGPENAILPIGKPRYNTGTLSLDTKPLKWNSESLIYTDGNNPQGITLTRPADYDYNQAEAFAGQIRILNPTVQTRLTNTLTGGTPQGFLNTTYTNVSQSGSLRHGQILTVTFYRTGSPIPIPWTVLTLNNETGAIFITGNWSFGVDVLSADYTWRGPLSGATVNIINTTRREAISAPLTTNSAGRVFARVWGGGTFDVKVTADEYQPAVSTYVVTGDSNNTILMYKAWVIWAIAQSPEIDRITDGLTGVMIQTGPGLVNPEIRVLTGQVTENVVTFWAGNGDYLLIVDAKGKTAYSQSIIVNNRNQTVVATMDNSPKEEYSSAVSFNGQDWNNITVWRNVTLLQDSVFPGIPNGNLRNLRWQLDLDPKFGDANGALSAAEMARIRAFVHDNGPFYVVTDNFLTVNGKAYRSDPNNATFTATVLDGPGTNFTINTTQRYTVSDNTSYLRRNQSAYYVNVTTMADQNTTVYQNNSYLINVPATYEMTTRTVTGNVITKFHTNVTVDPGVDTQVPNPRVNMIIEKSINGTARAQVEGPVGKVYVKNADQNAYKAWVANDTKIIFTANATTDRQNKAINVKDANFTWEFNRENQTAGSNISWGIWTWNNFTNVGDWFTVHLTVRQANPTNVTQRWINVTVDNVAPTAVIKTNRTTMDNPPTFPINETVFTTFIATNSTDVLYTGASETGLVREWSWDFDGDGKVDRLGSSVSWNYSKPGNFNTTLFVTDQVGHKSANRTMPVTVRDITPPKVAITILDKSNSWKETSALVEKKTYYFNASKTSDNSLKHAWDNVNLTYKFYWGDNSNTTTAQTHDNRTLNVTHTWTKFGSNYKLNISATDPSGNVGWLNQTMVIQANTTAHPDLNIISNSLVVNPTTPEEGGTVQFSINFTNAKGKATATDLKLNLTMSVSGKDQQQPVANVQWVDSGGNAITSLAAGVNGTLKFTWVAPSVGNKSLKIKIWDGNEPDAWITVANEQTTSIAVKEAGWKFWAIVGGFIFVVVGLPIIYYVVRKVRAGEWTLRRTRKDEDEEEEEEEEEEDEDAEDTGGKKRL